VPILVYNSLTQRKEELIPLQDKTVNIYTCGVTVYDKCHIGHARSLYVFDVIRCYLKYRGYDVRFVRNITDIDDKIINKAKEINKTSQEVAEENIKSYREDLKRLKIEEADVEPKATENIPGMIEHIKELIAHGAAYEVNGDVYFNVRKFEKYGQLSGQSVEKMMDAVRIEPISIKKDPLDFALWKRSKENEPSWDSPWGQGRPGWHIECSVMSLKHLKCETLDIHAGGRDLIFPHHENEIAQVEAISKKPFAKYWLHHGLLTINSQKMAKSAKNFITIEEAVKRYPVDDLKMLFLSSHYASPVDFSEEKMAEAHKAMQRFDILFWKAAKIMEGKESLDFVDTDFIEVHRGRFLAAMDDDFNTAKALGNLFDLVNDTNKFIDEKQSDKYYVDIIHTSVDTIENLAREVFGLFLDEKEVELTEAEQTLLEERKTARFKKDFKRSDELRERLKQMGIAVEDAKTGQTWRRI